ncbi:MAG: CAP domain-containing protein [Candidatus Beckwithbacteria bacterium]|nr:CAP domain-containing protein [Candidatus Beckwithbacteria bacterium]
MIHLLSHLFTPQESNNYKAKTLHASSLSVLLVLVIFTQVCFSFLGARMPGVLGINSSITADEIVNLTNKTREENGLPVLTISPLLSEAAQEKGADMIAKNYWAHASPDGTTPWDFFKNVHYQYLYAGENLARDFQDSPSVITAWMNSPTHRDNLLSGRYREIGIAVIQDTFQGQPTTLIVQLFGTQVSSALPVKTGEINANAEAVLAEIKTSPLISSFHLTKAISISLTIILIAVILIDSAIVTKKKIIRLSGSSLAHLIFLGILLILLVGIQPGLIL